MEGAAVQFLLDNLKQLLLYHAHLIRDSTSQVENLENDLRLFKAFLEESTKKRKRDDEALRELVRQIIDVVYEAEDTIDACVALASDNKFKNFFLRAFYNPLAKLPKVAKKVEEIGGKIKKIYDRNDLIDFASAETDGGAAEDKIPGEKKDPLIRQENIVGLEDETDTIIKYLTEESEELDVISIIGMPGLGKTTLAGKIFRDHRIQFEFPTRIWVYVSQEFRKRDVFLSILSKFMKITDEMYRKNDQDIVNLLVENLESGKFLIVMDDVWTAEAWKELQNAFPKANNMCKILITSRNEEVAWQANRDREPHKLRLLTPEESWLLLRLEVFGKPEFPSELEVLGKLIVQRCGFLPLAIVVIGGTLVKKALAGDMRASKNAWEKVSESVSTHLNEDPDERMEKIISLSYNKLPYCLRPCFLYLGMFPEDFEIPVKRLTLMWIAEGFIQQKPAISLEETAEDYLDDLISRNLVMVDKVSPDGKIKTCRIHDMLREFCKNEAGNTKENFFQEMKMSIGGTFEPSLPQVEKFRRLCIHSNVVSFISAKPLGPRVRSFLCLSKEEITLLPENISSIPLAFNLLRVLEGKSFKFTKFPSDLTSLIHLRYLVLSSNFKILPDSISKLWNIQTLIVETTSRGLEIKTDKWKLIQLRHLKINASTTLLKTSKTKGGEKLQTLGTISPQSCTEDFFDKVRGLKKLGIRGKIATLLEVKGLEKLGNLDKLKLVNDTFPLPPSECKVPQLPQPYKFPQKLRSLTLSATFLDWSHMSTLAMLDTLELLKLKDNAFVGRSWEATDGGFRHLEFLLVERTDLVVWVASGHHFPGLRCLVLRNCEKLGEIPFGLVDTLHKLDLKRVSKSASCSARKIEAAKKEKQGAEVLSKRNQFKLCIAPGDE
ncbi:putative late blight resistance protein homolog R1A-10 [Primulina tabacum]|uniref:putative late blight resistance protein homolog R1A-10 n=1 Tax=Primulina tabacum TaxID=48773 RepID=UPI003F5A9CCD